MSEPADLSHILTAKLPGEAVLLDLETKRYFQLNETAARIWELLQQGTAPAQVAETLMAEFTVDATTANDAVRDVIARLRAVRVLRDGG